MKKLLVTLSVLLAANTIPTVHATDWGYTGNTAPNKWASLSPEFSMCNGSNQSPINITDAVNATLSPITFSYTQGSTDILNNGHTVQVNTKAGNSIELDGIRFELKQFHFHVPSENEINSQSYPMEVHLVHADANNNLAVVAVMFSAGKYNEFLQHVWQQVPGINQKSALNSDLLASALLPTEQQYYRFNGSLTTPPCSEGVRWIVMKQPITASAEQISEFLQFVAHHNNRPLQPLNARLVLQ